MLYKETSSYVSGSISNGSTNSSHSCSDNTFSSFLRDSQTQNKNKVNTFWIIQAKELALQDFYFSSFSLTWIQIRGLERSD